MGARGDPSSDLHAGFPLMLTNLSAVAGPDDSTWPVEGRLIGEKGKKSKDISGIACAKPQGFPRSCLVIDDNGQQAQFVTLKDGEIVAGNSIRLIEDALGGQPLELDGEGVAFADGA